MAKESEGSTVSVDDHIVAVSGLSRSLQADLIGALERISEINRMTSIISMNARVEAARVGRVGAGFGVIAEEMSRLSRMVAGVAGDLDAKARNSGHSMEGTLGKLSRDVREIRLCELALTNIDLIDRNLYERSCDVRWWATDGAAVSAAQQGDGESLAFASKRLGQILDSYTVYHDLVIADLSGRVLTNGRPAKFSSAGSQVDNTDWFRSALATRSGEQFGFQSAHASELAGGRGALVYSCVIREGGRVDGRPVGVLGIIFNWTALAQTIINNTPLSATERQRSRICIVDDRGQVLADSDEVRIGSQLDFNGRDGLFKQARGAVMATVEGAQCCIAHAASPGYETYRTGWHSLILQRV
jgi:hypothetical protein